MEGGGPFLFPAGGCAKAIDTIRDKAAVTISFFLTNINFDCEIILVFVLRPAAYGKRL
jgi:hypothetical protein